MGLPLIVGNAAIAMAPVLAVFGLMVSKRPQLIIMVIIAGFFWLNAAWLSTWPGLIPGVLDNSGSHAWLLLLPSVIMQFLVRYAYFRTYRRLEKGVIDMFGGVRVLPMDDLTSALAAGVGFAGMYVLVMYGGILQYAGGLATLVAPQCGMSLFLLNSMTAYLFAILHLLWMLLAFDAFRRTSRLQYAIILASHLLASAVTLFNDAPGGCALALPLLAVITLAVAANTYWVMRSKQYMRALVPAHA
eukprot:PLAT6931.1.p2 GENE.PLAT6931.1~~PLAT6931.1.p2  ORF type:complete len:254 (+),score=127.98 PLAT6931.1:30-764(+)